MSETLEVKKPPVNVLANIAVYLALFVGLWFGFNWWTNHKVASDAQDKYEMALSNNDKPTACFQAGVVASSYLSAKDEEAYKKWQAIEMKTCK